MGKASRTKVDATRREKIAAQRAAERDRKSTRLNSSHSQISYAVFCLKKKTPSSCRAGFCWVAPPPSGVDVQPPTEGKPPSAGACLAGLTRLRLLWSANAPPTNFRSHL